MRRQKRRNRRCKKYYQVIKKQNPKKCQEAAQADRALRDYVKPNKYFQKDSLEAIRHQDIS